MRAAAILCALSLLGCPGWLPAVTAGASWLGALLDVARAGADAYLARHPSMEAMSAVDQAELRARKALAGLNEALAAHDRAKAASSRQEAIAAYGELVATLDRLGVSSAAPAVGGAEGEAPAPSPVELPSVAEVSRILEAE